MTDNIRALAEKISDIWFGTDIHANAIHQIEKLLQEKLIHDHNTATCETCKSVDDYCKEQYAGYEKQVKEARSAAFSEAAKIAEDHDCNCGRGGERLCSCLRGADQIAAKLRQKAGEER